jgi:hypothetical protein
MVLLDSFSKVLDITAWGLFFYEVIKISKISKM